MNKESKKQVLLKYNVVFDVLFSLETIIKLTRQYCLDREVASKVNNTLALSEERNQYICMLSIALEKLEELKKFNLELEDKFSIL